MKATTILLTLSVGSWIWNAIAYCPPYSLIDVFSHSCFWKIDYLLDVPTCYSFCLNKGGRLAEITNSFTNTFIFNFMPFTECLWIAVTDSVTESQFKTFSGQLQTFLPWDASAKEPDGSIHPEQDCVYMSHVSNGLWRDDSCYKRCHCLCSNVTYDIDAETYRTVYSSYSHQLYGSGVDSVYKLPDPTSDITTTTTTSKRRHSQFYYMRKTDNPCSIVNNTAEMGDQSFLDCVDICSSQKDCVAFSFQENVSKCYLHQDETCFSSESSDIISYVKRY